MNLSTSGPPDGPLAGVAEACLRRTVATPGAGADPPGNGDGERVVGETIRFGLGRRLRLGSHSRRVAPRRPTLTRTGRPRWRFGRACGTPRPGQAGRIRRRRGVTPS